jgi:hypothetical protein
LIKLICPNHGNEGSGEERAIFSNTSLKIMVDWKNEVR